MATQADKTLEILIRTRSDRTGSQETLTDLNAVGTMSKSVAEQLAAAGARYDAAKRSFVSIDTKPFAESGKDAAANWLLAGMSLSKARAEALVLGRELVTGSFNARTLGSLLGALGPIMTVGAIAGFGLFEIIKKQVEEAKKFDDELAKQSQNLFKQIDQWRELAATAGTFSDVLRIMQSVDSELGKASEKLQSIRQEQQSTLDFYQKLRQAGVDLESGDPYSAGGKRTPADEKVAQQSQILSKLVQSGEEEIAVAERTRAAWDAIKLEPVAQGLADIIAKVNELRAQTERMRPLTILPPNATPGQIAAAAEALHQYFLAVRELDVWENRQQSQQKKVDRADEIAQRKQLTELLRQDSALLRDIRAEEAITEKNPFLGVDEKQVLLHQQFISEQHELISQIDKTKQAYDAAMGAGEADKAEQLKEKIHALTFEYAQLEFKVQTTTFGGALRAELFTWVNSFGTAAHQVAGIITGTLNTAIGATANALTGLIFRTGNWRQTFAQAAQSIVGEIIKIGLQFAVSRLFMSVINRTAGTADTIAASAAAAPVAAAWSSAATSASIATYGVADAEGVAAYIAALASGKAAAIASAGFRKGHFTGEGHPDDIAGFVHKKEFVFTAEETEKLGVPFLQRLAAAAGGTAITSQKTGRIAPPMLQGYQQGGFVYEGRHYNFGYNPITGLPEFETYDSTTGIWQSVPLSALGSRGQPIVELGGGPRGISGTGISVTPGGYSWSPTGVVGAQAAFQDYNMATSQWGTYGIGWAYDAAGDPQPMSFFASTGQQPQNPFAGASVGGSGSASGGGGVGSIGGHIVYVPGWAFATVQRLGLGMTGPGSGYSASIGAGHAMSAALAFALGTSLGLSGPDPWSLQHGAAVNESAGTADDLKLARSAALAGMTVEDYLAAQSQLPVGPSALAAVGSPIGWTFHAAAGGGGFSQKKGILHASWDYAAGHVIGTPSGYWAPVWSAAQQAILRSAYGKDWKYAMRISGSHGSPPTLAISKSAPPILGPSGIMTPGAAIPVIAPGLLVPGSSGGAAMLDDLGLGGGSYKPGRRYHTGGLIDEMFITAQPGEFMQSIPAVSKYGRDFMRALNDQQISVASVRSLMKGGGELITGSPGAGTSGGLATSGEKFEFHIHNSDFDTAVRHYNESPAARKLFVRSVKRHK